MKMRSLVLLAVQFGLFFQINSQEECQRGGCFPATGDLLVGRENRLNVSSTCGLKGREKYCVLSFLEKSANCFYCQSTREVDDTPQGYKSSHLPKYMVTSSPKDRLKGWWQSENGKQEVTIGLDLEAEFVFTHLIMTFKTFRPKAMLIERSWNYGGNWSVYRYFAYDCAKSFPKISRGPQMKIDDIICDERYSKVEPSSEGEVVMKVLDPIIQQKEDPYSLNVQNLLKLTNLRIRMTELHTFGDDVLGDNPEVNKKYYYALYEMVVRGSCSCYGHAEHCIPAKGALANVDMVHGKCNCTHFTTGLNCEKCMDGYNDEPWKPGYKDQINACKKCNCNGHTNKCHFDPAVYRATENTSGGVCDDCQHNTAGRQCEQCKPLYYRDPFKNIFDTDVCKPCDCDPSGSFGGGECETLTTEGSTNSVAGRCICKTNAVGLRCDRCKDGYWNMLESNPDGCQSCNCDDRGTVTNNKCDQQQGTCRCKRFVKGLTCSKCSDGYWALGTTPEGCKPCGCDPGGAKNSTCDDISGMCQCRQYLTGRKCDKVLPGYYFANPDQIKYEAENTQGSSTSTLISRRITGGIGEVKFTGEGFLQVQQNSIVRLNDVEVPYSGKYSVVFRYDNNNFGDWDNIQIIVTKSNGERLGTKECAPYDGREQTFYGSLPRDKVATVVVDSVCLEKGSDYNFRIDFKSNNGRGNVQTFIDSIILMPIPDDLEIFKGREGLQRKKIYEQYNCQEYYKKLGDAINAPEECKEIQFSISSVINNGGLKCSCDPIGTRPTGGSDILTCNEEGGQCPCKDGVVGRRCDKCAVGFFGFGANGCTACDCSKVGSNSLFCHDTTGECSCKPQLVGRQCDKCPVNHYGFPNCRPCQCSGHSEKCDIVTGECIGCKHNTDGYNCHKCAEGYYGDATKGTDSDCQRCQCPGGSSTNQFSNTCRLQGDGKVICDNCVVGYTGDQCEKCSDGYYGDPLTEGGSCKKCDCSGNIDPFADNKCDTKTGVCNNCLNNAAGDRCGECKEGFFGNAKTQSCRRCVCNELGTDKTKGECDQVSGQCPCLENVEGLQCDKCASGYYNLASGKGCEPCACDEEGSLEGSCNQMDGQCRCRVGFGGRNCSQCEDFSWGNPKEQDGCKACGCNPIGSMVLQCDRSNGVCQCKSNVLGEKCDMCAPRTSGVMPKCETCHTCNDQWEDIVNILEKNVTNLLKYKGNFTYNSTEIILYNKEIEALNDLLKMIEDLMSNRSVDADEVDKLREEVIKFRDELMQKDAVADRYTGQVADTSIRTMNANVDLDSLDLRFIKLKEDAKKLKINITNIVESDVGGALNSTRESLRRSNEAKTSIENSTEIVKASKKIRKKIKKEIILGDPTFEDLDKENNILLNNLTSKINSLEDTLKTLNKMLCGGSDECGGCNATGCATCGAAGGTCTGVKQQAIQALAKANEAKTKLQEKKAKAEILLADVRMAEEAVNASKEATDLAEKSSREAKRIGEEVLGNITSLIQDINDFLNTEFKHPNISKALAIETIGLNISLTPEEVKKLANEINKTVHSLEGVDKILNESRKDYLSAMDLKKRALEARDYALQVMNKTEGILGMLSKAAELQNSTTAMIGVARADIKKADDLIKKLTEKLDNLEDDLTTASNNTDDLEKQRDEVKDIHEENRKKLTVAEEEADKAAVLAKKVNETSEEVNRKYDEAKKNLADKQNATNAIKERLERLGKGAIDLFRSALTKLELIEELKQKYLRNEIRVRDMLDAIKRLEIKALYGRDKIFKLSQCHTKCNPSEGKICTNLETLDKEEKDKLAAHDLAVENRISAE